MVKIFHHYNYKILFLDVIVLNKMYIFMEMEIIFYHWSILIKYLITYNTS